MAKKITYKGDVIMDRLEEYKDDILKAIDNMSKESDSELVKWALYNVKAIVIELYNNRKEK